MIYICLNCAFSYEGLSDLKEAASYFELSLDEYQQETPPNFRMSADVAVHVGQLHSRNKDMLRAARAYEIASTAFKHNEDFDNQCVCMCHQMSALLKANQNTAAGKVADDCMNQCVLFKNSDNIGKF